MKASEYVCPVSGLITRDSRCTVRHEACGSCGWNPRVHRERVKLIRALAAMGRLGEWGK